jgi:hypothetical protein
MFRTPLDVLGAPDPLSDVAARFERMTVRKIIVAIGLFAASTTATSAQQRIRFANVPWGATKVETTQRIVAAGFTFDREDKDGDLQFSGPVPLLGERAVLFAFFAPDDKLVKVQLTIIPPDDRVLDVYRTVKQSLTDTFGYPRREVEHYTYPFDEGGAVGHETTAIRNGKGVVATLWGGGPPNDGLALIVTDKLTDDLTYESAYWSAELERRKRSSGVY